MALDSFEAARGALDRLLEGQPSDAAARELRRDVIHMIQIANKDLGFF